jgi:superoxide dismutase, Cu-Zn family
MPLISAIAVMMCGDFHHHGNIFLKEESEDGPVIIDVDINGLTPGKHGFHVHKSGNVLYSGEKVCSHYNPTNQEHGKLNSSKAHVGDLGNLEFDNNQKCKITFKAKYLRLRGDTSIIGRSLVVHEKEDDLGKGKNDESKLNGNSGGKILYGIIAFDESCDS